MWIMYCLVMGCTLFVYVDATKNKIGKIPDEKNFTNMSAGMWAFGTAMLWIVVFPLYLINRKKLIALGLEKPRLVPAVQRYAIITLMVSVCLLVLLGNVA